MKEKKQELKQGYFTDKTLLKAISKIKKLIGKQDSCLQTNQAAILFLEEHAKVSGDSAKFLNDLCAKSKISRGTNDLERFKSSAAAGVPDVS